MGRHLFTGRQEGERGGQHVRRRGDQRRQRRAACQVAGDRLAVGLHDEHAPVARVVGGDRFLLDHDLVKTGNIVQIVGDGQRLFADLPPLGGETFGVGEQRGAVEHRLALNAAIVNIAQCEHGPIINRGHNDLASENAKWTLRAVLRRGASSAAAGGEERQEKLVRFKRLAQHLCNRVSANVSKCGEKNHTIKV